MSILVGTHTRLLVQGITGKEGSFQTRRCIEYGTKVVAGVTPGRGGGTAGGGAVFDTVAEAGGERDGDVGPVFRAGPVRGGGGVGGGGRRRGDWADAGGGGADV